MPAKRHLTNVMLTTEQHLEECNQHQAKNLATSATGAVLRVLDRETIMSRFSKRCLPVAVELSVTASGLEKPYSSHLHIFIRTQSRHQGIINAMTIEQYLSIEQKSLLLPISCNGLGVSGSPETLSALLWGISLSTQPAKCLVRECRTEIQRLLDHEVGPKSYQVTTEVALATEMEETQ